MVKAILFSAVWLIGISAVFGAYDLEFGSMFGLLYVFLVFMPIVAVMQKVSGALITPLELGLVLFLVWAVFAVAPRELRDVTLLVTSISCVLLLRIYRRFFVRAVKTDPARHNSEND